MQAYQKKIDAGATDHDAVMYADTLIDRTTGSGRKIDVPRILRGNTVERTLTMYKTFMLTQYNAWALEHQIFLKEKDITRVITQVAAKWWLFTLSSMLLSGKLIGDDDDLAEKVIAEIIGYPAGFFPILGDMVNIGVKQALGVKSFDFRASPLEGVATDALKIIPDTVKAIQGKKDAAEALETMSKSAAYVRGYPDQFNDWFWNAYDILVNDMDMEARDLIRRRAKRER
jgi:hypothetical protein